MPLQEEIVTELACFEEQLVLPKLNLSKRARQWVRAALYDAYDLVWQLEELLTDEPDTSRLSTCVELISVFAPGSESHVALAMRLDDSVQFAAAQFLRGARGKRRTAAAERRLLAKVQVLTASAEEAAASFYRAVFCR